jgi:hypothetical protein
MALEEDGPTDAHKYILQLLGTEPGFPGKDKLELSPSCIARSTGYKDSNHVAIVCRELADAGLIRKTEGKGTYYVITWRGQAYLEGELSLDGLDEDEE